MKNNSIVKVLPGSILKNVTRTCLLSTSFIQQQYAFFAHLGVSQWEVEKH
ncbi:hypothetical protein [Shewanella aestuarii]|uniref:Uncharacterized protein n=1 Tax=Shewanella aestuarii TaxID=1028752 RepID=A0A6G9QGA2_9GAMM|nr:hypothetical protein [Shewanella aestuarii]QIR13502.1 hypothetical protein HBH39_02455 [Shewanella aestuarii]